MVEQRVLWCFRALPRFSRVVNLEICSTCPQLSGAAVDQRGLIVGQLCVVPIPAVDRYVLFKLQVGRLLLFSFFLCWTLVLHSNIIHHRCCVCSCSSQVFIPSYKILSNENFFLNFFISGPVIFRILGEFTLQSQWMCNWHVQMCPFIPQCWFILILQL